MPWCHTFIDGLANTPEMCPEEVLAVDAIIGKAAADLASTLCTSDPDLDFWQAFEVAKGELIIAAEDAAKMVRGVPEIDGVPDWGGD